MKLFSSLAAATAAVLFAAGTTSAQDEFLAYPPETSVFVRLGQRFVFRLERPPSTHPVELTVTVGLQTCPGNDGCSRDTSNNLGKVVLTKTKFDPKGLDDGGGKQRYSYQEFAFVIPKDTATGAVLVKVRRESKLKDLKYKDLSVVLWVH